MTHNKYIATSVQILHPATEYIWRKREIFTGHSIHDWPLISVDPQAYYKWRHARDGRIWVALRRDLPYVHLVQIVRTHRVNVVGQMRPAGRNRTLQDLYSGQTNPSSLIIGVTAESCNPPSLRALPLPLLAPFITLPHRGEGGGRVEGRGR